MKKSLENLSHGTEKEKKVQFLVIVEVFTTFAEFYFDYGGGKKTGGAR